MLNKISLTAALLLIPAMTSADEVQVNPDRPDKYVVEKGDTLWGIAGRFLAEPWRWPEIWKGNPQIADPNLIYPGDVVSLTYEGGSPVLSVSGGAGDRNVKLSPEVRTEPRDDAIPTIPIEAIREFLSRPLVLNEGEIDAWPYIVSSYDRHLVSGTGNRIYVRGLKGNDGAERRYTLYRKGPAYRSRSGGRILGYEALYVGDAVVEKFGDPATLTITHAEREVLEGDRLVPQSREEASSDFIPRSPAKSVEGSIISVIDGLSEIGQYQVVVLDVGANSGVEVGNVLGVYQSGKVVTDDVAVGHSRSELGLNEWLSLNRSHGDKLALPEEYAGVIMVFRTFPEISYALVMEITNALKLSDSVRNL
ncbi:MAG: LysM peptidoglycan-binding domain-containing protein [Gammaproteobacteria bacterium]|nr:LysM peptidoglycan-binding domain-containing protein [Gammaproteobacteria bacterium]